MIASLFIVFTISELKTQGADTHMKTSFQTTASFRVQEILSLLVIANIFCFSLFKSFLDLDTIHLESQTTISQTQYNFKSFIIAVPAAHKPFTTTFISFLFFQTIFSEFISHARHTIAVPC
jgi:hypothetical protein